MQKMPLQDWNKALTYANNLKATFDKNQVPVRTEPYAMYDGHKGIAFHILDNNQQIYDTYYSGVHTCFDSMKMAMDDQTHRILAKYMP